MKFVTSALMMLASCHAFAAVLPIICYVGGRYVPLTSPTPGLITGEMTIENGITAAVRAGFIPNPIHKQIIQIRILDEHTGFTVMAEAHDSFDVKTLLADGNGVGYELVCRPAP